jgi:hypothetical protein
MPHIRHSISSFVQRLIGWVGCCGILVLMGGCDGASTTTPQAQLEFKQDIHAWRQVWDHPEFKMTATAANLGFRGLGEQQRALLDGVKVDVADPAGRALIQLSANKAISLHPYTEISLQGISVQVEDAATFEAEVLVWPYAGDVGHLGLLGPTLLMTDDYMVEGDTVVGDLLLQGYEILHVVSVVDLRADSVDTAAGQ